MNQYWTAVIVRDDHYESRDHFGSFSAHVAKSEIELTIPLGSKVVALVPGKHSQNTALFNEKASIPDGVRFINPYDSVKV